MPKPRNLVLNTPKMQLSVPEENTLDVRYKYYNSSKWSPWESIAGVTKEVIQTIETVKEFFERTDMEELLELLDKINEIKDLIDTLNLDNKMDALINNDNIIEDLTELDDDDFKYNTAFLNKG